MSKSPSKPPLRIAFFAPYDFEYVQRLVDGVLRYQTDRGGCTIRDFRYDPKAPEDPVAWSKRARPWESWKPHGLIVNIPADPGLPQWVGASGIPVVNTASSLTPFPSVHLSFDDIARRAFEHFDALGFKHFAYVTCDPPIERRAEAFRRHLRARGIPLRIVTCAMNPAHWDDEIVVQLALSADMVSLLRDAPKPLAVLACNDHMGRVACWGAQQLGLKIPEEVAVLGINNHSICRTSGPPLSSIDAPGEKVGFKAMELLVGLINGVPAPMETQIDPGKVYARESTVATRDKEADLQHAMQVIRDRACEGLSVDEIVAELNMSPSTLRRRFLATLGRTPAEEITRIRIERAMELLSKTDVPITRLAGMFGYGSTANFTHFFQNHTGMNPRTYRKSHGRS